MENVKLMQEYGQKHFRKETAKIKEDKETQEENRKKGWI